jgi:hypothetical protein
MGHDALGVTVSHAVSHILSACSKLKIRKLKIRKPKDSTTKAEQVCWPPESYLSLSI